MTIELTVRFQRDAFSGDPLVMLRREAFSNGARLAAAEWTVVRKPGVEVFQHVLHSVFSQIATNLPDYEIWLLTGDSVWQSDTRIVRYRKKFNALKAQGMDFESIPERFEYAVEDGDKVKFFGAARLHEAVLRAVALTMPPRACTYVAVIPKGDEKKFVLSTGWTGQWNDDAAFIEMIAQSDGILLQRVGFFDDPEVGLMAVGNPNALAQILS